MPLGSVQDEAEAMDARPANRELWSLFQPGSEHIEPLQEVFEAMTALDSG
jgi:hypothetical protein